MRQWMFTAAVVASGSIVSAQTPPATITPPATPTPALTAPASPIIPVTPQAPVVRPTGTAANVNGTDIPEVAVFRALRQFPPAEHEIARKEIINHLVENAIIDQYLTALKITAEPAEIDKLIEELKAELKKANKDYAKELEGMMLTEAEFRAEVSAQMKWDKFVKQQATDDNLKKLFESNPLLFDGSMVRARHILMNPGADPAKKAAAKETLLKIKAAVEGEANKVVAALPPTTDAMAKETAKGKRADEAFSQYAQQHSICPSKKEGGDLNYFPRVGTMVEPFAKVAFELPIFGMSDVVETEFGLHLILVTAKKPGVARPFDQVKDDVRGVYAVRLREAVIGAMKPKAAIKVNPTTTTTGGM